MLGWLCQGLEPLNPGGTQTLWVQESFLSMLHKPELFDETFWVGS